jgi:hypothetical protein
VKDDGFLRLSKKDGFYIILYFYYVLRVPVTDYLLPSFLPFPSREVVPEATRINLVTSGDIMS